MSCSWRLLETTNGLVDQLAGRIEDLTELTSSLEQNGLLSGDSVDYALVRGPIETIRSIINRISVKDEDAFRRFKRTLIESGEYDAVQLLCDAIQNPEEEKKPKSPTPSSSHESSQQVLGTDLTRRDFQIPLPAPLMHRVSSISVGSDQSAGEETVSNLDEEAFNTRLAIKADMSFNQTLQPTTTKVQMGTELFQGPRIYKLTSNPRGLCVIFNNRYFPNIPDKDRPGSELDVTRMVMLFQAFQFTVFVHSDQPSRSILSLLETYANETVQEGNDAFVLIMMSHGATHHIYGNDYNPVKLQSIFEKFNNVNCPTLKERPKLFFIQACRGDQPDNGTDAREQLSEIFQDDSTHSDAGMVPAGRDPAPRYPEHSTEFRRRIASWSDMYIAYAVVEGYESLRDASSGSWFMKAIYDMMANYAHKEDLDSLMDRVSHEVLERSRNDGQRQCPEVKKIGWRKKLYFNPGI